MRRLASRRRCTVRSGFSLVELMTVLGIITILMALSIPALISARRQAQITQCQSNLHQLTVALINYSVEFKGEFPPNVGAKKAFWYNNSAIGHYIRGPSELAETVYQQINGVFVCPADLDNTVRSYSMNTFASSEVSPSTAAAIAANPPRGKLFKAGASPGSKLILFSEAFAVEDFPEEDPNPIGYSAPALVGFAPKLVGKRFGATGALYRRDTERYGNIACQMCYFHHRKPHQIGGLGDAIGRVNIAFLDGHVALFSPDQLFDEHTGKSTFEALWSPIDREIP